LQIAIITTNAAQYIPVVPINSSTLDSLPVEKNIKYTTCEKKTPEGLKMRAGKHSKHQTWIFGYYD
jgi:hypothetical protein